MQANAQVTMCTVSGILPAERSDILGMHAKICLWTRKIVLFRIPPIDSAFLFVS